jgi:hypothetical protein
MFLLKLINIYKKKYKFLWKNLKKGFYKIKNFKKMIWAIQNKFKHI